MQPGVVRKYEALDKPLPPPSLQICDALHCNAPAWRNQFIRCIIALVSMHLAHGLVSNDTVPAINLPQREIVVLSPLTRVHNKHPLAISEQRTIEARDDATPKQLHDESCDFLAYIGSGSESAPPACLFAIPFLKLCVGIEIAI